MLAIHAQKSADLDSQGPLEHCDRFGGTDLIDHSGPTRADLAIDQTNLESATQDQPHGHGDGHFHVKAYPKSKRPRRLKLDPALVNPIVAHIQQHKIGPDDLLFQIDQFEASALSKPRLIDADALGHTEPNAAGRRYQHGTLSAYTVGRCRCEHCRASIARYRAERRAKGLDSPRGKRKRDSDGHLPRDWFRFNIWYPACAKANLKPRPRLHDLRHSHASWLLAGGADLQGCTREARARKHRHHEQVPAHASYR